MHYFVSQIVHAWRKFWGYWEWMSWRLLCQNPAVSLWLHMNRRWPLTIFKNCALCCVRTDFSKSFPSVRNVIRESLSPLPQPVCSYLGPWVQKIALKWVYDLCHTSFLMILKAFSHLQDWPGLAITFQKLVEKATDSSSQFGTFPNPMLSLMHMAARNGLATKYLAIEENFVLAALHVAAMKNIPFTEGTLPDCTRRESWRHLFPIPVPAILSSNSCYFHRHLFCLLR